MTDTVDKATRSKIMAAVRGKDTSPEIRVRKYLHAKGLRFSLHRKGLPGTPDLVFPRYKTVVFVHGCFWHRHGCKRTTTPKSNVEYWEEKFRATVIRDRKVRKKLKNLGWKVLVVWECELDDERLSELATKIVRYHS